MDVSESLVKIVLKTTVAQTWATYCFLILWSHVVQMHLLVLLCNLVRINAYVDFVIDVCASLALQDVLRVVSWALVDKYKDLFATMLRPLFHSPPSQKAAHKNGRACVTDGLRCGRREDRSR